MNSIKKSTLSERRWIPDGFHFLGPEESQIRRNLLESFNQCFNDAGYSEIHLPAFDYTSSFQSQIGGLEPSAFLTAKDYDGFSLSPGIDLTLQVVKGMAARSHWKENQKVYYVGRKIRDHKKHNATRREILQIGGECIGDSSLEIVISQVQILEKMWQLSVKEANASFVLGHAGFLSFIFEILALDYDGEALLAQFLYTKNFPELMYFVEKRGIDSDLTELLKVLLKPVPFSSFNEFKQTFLSLNKNSKWKERILLFFNEIESFINIWKREKISFNGIWDPALIRDLDYYSGLVFQGYMYGYSEPVFAGGVYNSLYETFSALEKDACGFALHIDPIEEKIYSKK
jgi:ATP phosphoribosyltransferase regulatory subunit